MSGGAPREGFSLLVPEFEKQTGHKVTMIYAVPTVVREKLKSDEKADVMVMVEPDLDAFIKKGKVRADTRAAFGTYGLSIVVQEGKPKPDVSTREKFRDAMIAARSVAHSPPVQTPSGTYVHNMLGELGLADIMAKKVLHRSLLSGGAQSVVTGEVEIGVYATSEVMKVKGLTVVGPLPAGLQPNIIYMLGVMSDAAEADAAAAFVKFINRPQIVAGDRLRPATRIDSGVARSLSRRHRPAGCGLSPRLRRRSQDRPQQRRFPRASRSGRSESATASARGPLGR